MSDEVREGDILAGKFRIERVLGQGGMGVVVAATHIQLDERVALKFLLPEALLNVEAVARFAREARASVKIKSEHVARVSDVGTLESGSPYMVMEYLEGQDLAGFVGSRGAMPIHDAVEFVLQACEALAEAHALGIVHRDLKPANLFVTLRADGTPCVKVLDFGISKFTTPGSSSDMGMTKTSTVMGSPLYMSPEQLSSSRNVDARTDIWAIGVILYEVISGRVPFEAETMPQLCGMILQESPPALSSLRADVPAGLEEVIHHCLAKDRAQRFANVAELARALAPFGPPSAMRSAERIARVLRAPGVQNVADSGSPGAVEATTSGALALPQAAHPQRTKATVWLAFAAGAAALFGGAVWALHRSAPVSGPPSEPSVSNVGAGAAPVVSVVPLEHDGESIAAPRPPEPLPSALPGSSAPLPVPSASLRPPVPPSHSVPAKRVAPVPPKAGRPNALAGKPARPSAAEPDGESPLDGRH